MARFRRITPVFKVADIGRAVAFYTGLLGFQIAWKAPNDGGGENAMLERDGVAVLLSTGEHLGGKPAFTGTIYFAVEGVEKLFEALKGQVEVVWPLEVMEYGQKEFGIRDPDGYVLAFAERLAD